MFLPAHKLKRRYLASGRFYRIEYLGRIIPCRSTLEIYTKECTFDSREPDAFVIMENPGGSESLGDSEGHIDGALYSSTDVNLANKIHDTVLTPAKPDRTQYQVMRLMSFYNWDYVRILNLSDIRTTSSRFLIDLYSELNDDHLSIFSDIRETERSSRLQDVSNKPVIAAWGTSDGLRILAKLAMSKLPEQIKGLPGNQPYMFRHPLPRKYGEARKWLERFLKEVHFPEPSD